MNLSKKLKRTLSAITATTAAAILLAGCSVANTPPDQIALHYDGGAMVASKYIDCVDPSTYKTEGLGHTFYYYPTSLRTYSATGDEGAERKSFTVVSSDNAELTIPVTVTFTLTSDCDLLREFHESIGNRNKAFWGGSDFPDENQDGTPDGWVTVLNFYIGKALEATLDRASQGYEWRELWNNPEIKAEIEKAVEENLAVIVDDQMKGHYFDISTILLQTPTPVSEDLKNAVVAEQTAVANAKAAEAAAEAEKTSKVKAAEAAQAEAEARIAVAKAEAAQMEEQIRVLGQDGWIKKYGIDNGITPWPNPVVPGSGTTKQ